MSWSGPAEPNDRSEGGRRKRARGPRWVTDSAREIAGRQQAASRSDRGSDRRTPPHRQPPVEPTRHEHPRHEPPRGGARDAWRDDPPAAEPPRGRWARGPRDDRDTRDVYAPRDHAGGRDRTDPRDRRGAYPDGRPHGRDRHEPTADRAYRGPRDRGAHDDRAPYDRGPRDRGHRDDDRGPRDHGAHDRGRRDHSAYDDHGAYDRGRRDHGAYDRGYHDDDRGPRDHGRRDHGYRDDDGGPRGAYDDRGPYDRGRRDGDHEPYDDRDDTGPRKITVMRVAAWRSRQLTGRGLDAFRRATTADGADRSGLTALTYPTMLNYGADAAIAVAMANTLFFSAATAESKTKVALYLLITIAPFALIAPVIGPLLDRLQRGRRVALAASFVGRVVLTIVMAQHFDDWLLYPAALGVMVLSRSFNVLKAAVTPRVLPPDITLTKTNSRLAVFGLAAGGVIGAVAAGFAALLGSGGALWFTAVVCAAAAYTCLRIPAWVEVTEGEVPASLRDRGDGDRGDGDRGDGDRAGDAAPAAKRRREPLGKHVVVALWGNGTIRVLTGFLTLFVAFVVKAQTEQSPWAQVYLLGLVGAAAGAGSIAGNAFGARASFAKPDQVIVTCVAVVLSAALLAALISGITTAVIVALVGSVCSALAKVCLDATTQSDMSEESRASAFGRTETILQLSWTFGGALGVLLPPTYWIGFAVVSAVLALGLAQTVMAHRGGTLVPRFGGDRPVSSARAAASRLGRLRRGGSARSARSAGSPGAAEHQGGTESPTEPVRHAGPAALPAADRSQPARPTRPHHPAQPDAARTSSGVQPGMQPGSGAAAPAPTRRWEHDT